MGESGREWARVDQIGLGDIGLGGGRVLWEAKASGRGAG